MKSSKRVVKAVLSVALVLAMGVATLFTNAGTSYAAGEAKLNKTSRNILTRQSFDFDVDGAPADAVITWKSSDDKVATVDANGVVTGIKKGNVTITCKVVSAGKAQTLTAKVTICKPAVKLEIKNKVDELEYGKSLTFNTAIVPKTSNDVITWTSSDDKVATVDANGKVTALKEGKVTITATTMSGKVDSVALKVYGGPNATPTPTPKPTQKPKPTATPKPVASNVVYEQNFESDMGGWFDRGSTSAVVSGTSSPAGGKYLEITGRTSNWNGPGYELMSVLKAGKEYKFSAYVKQNSANGEVIKVTTDKNQGTQYTNICTATTNKGEWTLVESTFTIDADTTSLVIYFEADNTTLDFMADGVKIVDPKGSSTPTTPATPASNSYDITKLSEAGGYQYTQNGKKLSFDQQYAEAKYALPTAFTVKDFKTMKVSLASASDQIAYKLYDANGTQLAVWYGQTATAEFALTESHAGAIDQNAKVTVIGIMANNGACEAEVTEISFK